MGAGPVSWPTTRDVAHLADGVPLPRALAHPTPLIFGLALGIALLLALILAFAWRVRRTERELEQQEEVDESLSIVAEGSLPLQCFRGNGQPGDPLNIRVVATDAQLAAAFVAAGWYRADETTLITAFRITFDALFARQYPTAPMSNLYLYERRQDFAFQRPGASARERDHVRFWNTGVSALDGRPLWVGAATRDVDIALSAASHLPTHIIEPDVDQEREQIIIDLSETGWVDEQTYVPGFGEVTRRDNGDGGYYWTDGQVALLVLANVPVTLPFVEHVRGPSSPVAQRLARLLGTVRRRRQKQDGHGAGDGKRETERVGAGVTARGSSDRSDAA